MVFDGDSREALRADLAFHAIGFHARSRERSSAAFAAYCGSAATLCNSSGSDSRLYNSGMSCAQQVYFQAPSRIIVFALRLGSAYSANTGPGSFRVFGSSIHGARLVPSFGATCSTPASAVSVAESETRLTGAGHTPAVRPGTRMRSGTPHDPS